MWIVKLALRRPYTFLVASLLVFIVGVFLIAIPSPEQMPTDIFPNIDIPVIAVAFNYTGMSPTDMEQRIVGNFERILTTTVSDIDHTESQSLYGIGVIKIYFQKKAKIEQAIAQVAAISQTAIRSMPPGTQPPLIIQYNAADVPIIQLSLSSDTLPENQLFDIAINQLRPLLITIPGLESPYPYGGKQRDIIVDLDPEKLFAHGVSPAEVSAAINNQNLILPSGSIKIGTQEYQTHINSSPPTAADLNNLPIKSTGNTTTYVRDVASVRDGFIVQTNVVHTNGKRGVLVSILKHGNASTLQVVDAVRKALPDIRRALPPDLKITPMFDQSVFVRASVLGVVKEGAIAAVLTALMILLFLGSWRSTLIVMVSIPLSILVAIIVLALLGETLNVMTLGGMALAVGILVDDATVAIENIHRNLHMRKTLIQAILDGSAQIAVPAFVSTLCICIVFVPVVFITGAAKYLFTPLAEAVVFSMLTSYVISRTLVPTMINYLLPAEVGRYGGAQEAGYPTLDYARQKGRFARWLAPIVIGSLILLVGAVGAFSFTPAGQRLGLAGLNKWILANRLAILGWSMVTLAAVCLLWLIAAFHVVEIVHGGFNWAFEKFRRVYGGFLEFALDHRLFTTGAFTLLVLVSLPLFFFVGQDFFPSVDAGQLRLHVRCPPGTRIEETENRFARVEDEIRKIIPPSELGTLLDNMGIPNSSINLSLSDGSVMSPADGEILISLNENHHPTAQYMRLLRQDLAQKFPDLIFFFAPSDIVTQVLNFGISAPVDVQVAGFRANNQKDEQIAEDIMADLRKVPGIVDMRMQQVPRTPDIQVNVDRTLASQLGVTQRDVASDLLISLSSSNQVAPNFWLNPKTGINYSIYVQTPQYHMNSLNDLDNTPIVPTGLTATPENTQLLSNLAYTDRGYSPTNITHYNPSPTYDVLLGVQGTDLGSAADAIRNVIAKYQNDLPRGTKIVLRGQVQSMLESFTALGFGLIFAVLLVYLLMVINFQSWLDPLIILMALPGALCGILWILWATQTTISVPALMGAIMSIGVATANSILLITFANDQRELGMDSRQAALAAGLTRLRPVLMTASAMIIGMLPMALGMGEGGEQNAPLGRAVIGGLSLATFATLFFVPVVYSALRKKPRKAPLHQELLA
ncbi:MAG TPA: efflux RND transporter permease subunit [Phycisphaerae bacterium]|nr:efflux RND transporter permease subunit [Phycisphaerae bacterium]